MQIRETTNSLKAVTLQKQRLPSRQCPGGVEGVPGSGHRAGGAAHKVGGAGHRAGGPKNSAKFLLQRVMLNLRVSM